jgi:hypothetical protein
VNQSTRGERLQIMLTEDELKALDEWRFSKHMPSRAAAIRELLKRGLAAEGFVLADFRTKSKEFGVTGTVRDYDAFEINGASGADETSN